ncbi:ATP-binding protein [Neobacillus notoginsengisoli]|nr:ATP-binding protein [Neobacillus notoginsengisoli]
MSGSIEVAMKEEEASHYYQFYKSKDSYGNLVVYCFPISNRAAELKMAMDRLEKRVLAFNIEFASQKADMEKQAEELKAGKVYSEDLGKLAAGIAHEIRNPLTTVKGFIQLLKPELKEMGKEQYANVAIEEINRANMIIGEFLNATKPSARVKNETSVNGLVREVIMLYESESILRNIKLVSRYDENDNVYLLDSGRMKQVLVNLIKNAMEAIESSENKDRREIRINTNTAADGFSISIEDSGCGMDLETLSQLFSPFYSTKQNGNGIGLNVCKKIIEDHNGTIKVKSNVGKGSVFCISVTNSNT